jgi:phenylalanyl-tRNA synthetase alpha chain
MNVTTLDSIQETASMALSQAGDRPALEAWYQRYFGRERGELNALMREIPKLDPSERKAFGQGVNRIKAELEAEYQTRLQAIERAELDRRLGTERVDVTLPGRAIVTGHRHPLTQVLDRVADVFARLGFTLAEGPEVEDDWHNFTALNTPPDHPAREMQDTFYLADGRLLRTHTSSVQIRIMEQTQPPIRSLMPGRVYRRDTVTGRHYPIFHQIEGLAVDENVTFADLKGTLSVAMREIFGGDRKVRFRPSFFPFTEPSAEYDVECLCKGAGCRTCSYSGWLELGGCGMVDPNVFEAVKIDPERYTGFAFGFGAERIAMLMHDIPDIRLFWENDWRFLRQF